MTTKMTTQRSACWMSSGRGLLLLALLAAAAAGSSRAQEAAEVGGGAAAKPAAPGAAPVPMTPEARERMLRMTGGWISRSAEGPSVLFLDLRKTASEKKDAGLALLAADAGRILSFPVILETGSAKDVFKAVEDRLKEKRVASVVAVIDQPGFANILVAPENRWAIVNEAPLKQDKAGAEVLEARLRKQVWRAFGLMMGAGNTAHPHCPLKPILSLENLDAIQGRFLSHGPLNNMIAYGALIGLQRTRTVTYRRAVEEGWAPAPTNEHQQAIWDEARKPKKP